jgi:hypothetical protein
MGCALGDSQPKNSTFAGTFGGWSPNLHGAGNPPALIATKETVMPATVRQAFYSLVAMMVLICAAGGAQASAEDEVRAAFDRFVLVQNAHDAKALEPLLADSPQFLWITRGTAVWGREAALQRFANLYEGTWRLDPDPASVRVVPISENVAQLYAAVQFTIGAPGQPPQATRFLLNQVLVKSGGAWRVMSIFPIPAPAP